MGHGEPDYDTQDEMEITTDAQLRALGHVVRHQVIGVLRERAATISQLAPQLGVLKGSLSHHLRVLEDAGLVRIVRIRTVRGGTERYYGLTARQFSLSEFRRAGAARSLLLRTAAQELDAAPDTLLSHTWLKRARLGPSSFDLFIRRLDALVDEFAAMGTRNDPQATLTIGIFQNGVPPETK
jgi:DNA-binding transcriptional ArsR family regulator